MKQVNEAGSRHHHWVAAKKVANCDLPQFSAEEHCRLIGEAAYYQVLAQDFTLRHERDDWIEAEAEINRVLRDC